MQKWPSLSFKARIMSKSSKIFFVFLSRCSRTMVTVTRHTYALFDYPLES